MKTKVGISLNGRQLWDIDQRIIVQSVRESKPALKITATSVGGHIGQLVTSTERQYIDIAVEFAIAEVHDMMARAQILSRVSAWAAAGGKAEVTYRPGVYMDVVCQDMIDVGYVREWTNKYKLTLRAYGVPYWQDLQRVKVNGSASAVLNVPGTAPTPLEFEASAGTASDIVITMGGSKLHFSGYQLRTNDRLTVGHKNMILTAQLYDSVKNETLDALQLLAVDSNDEIMLQPGRNELTVTGASVTLYARGRWV